MGAPEDRRIRVRDIIDAHGVAAELGISRTSVYVYRHRHPDFPQPVIAHGPRCLMWHRGDIRTWVRSRGKGR